MIQQHASAMPSASNTTTHYQPTLQQQTDSTSTRAWSPSTIEAVSVVDFLSDENQESKFVSNDMSQYLNETRLVKSDMNPPPLVRSNTIDVSSLEDWPGTYNLSLQMPPENNRKNKVSTELCFLFLLSSMCCLLL